jgi:phage replication O-like protein O
VSDKWKVLDNQRMATLLVVHFGMANPQLENGHVKIANDIFEALMRIRISGEARQVLDTIIRKTYGFNKKEDAISLSQFCLATGLSKTGVCKGIAKLVSLNIITKKGNDIANVYSLVKDFTLWKPLPKKVTLPKKEIIVTQKGKKCYPKRDTQKTVTKDTITKDNSDETSQVEFSEEKEKYNALETRKKWYDGERQEFQLLAWYFDQKKLWDAFDSKGKVEHAARRHLRSAQRIIKADWSQTEVERARRKIPDKLNQEWTLETLEKYLTK